MVDPLVHAGTLGNIHKTKVLARGGSLPLGERHGVRDCLMQSVSFGVCILWER